jgi:hypothetical protein
MDGTAKNQAGRRRVRRRSLARATFQVALAICFVSATADVALASILPGPFEFSFFTPVLNGLFLLPFRMAGCG